VSDAIAIARSYFIPETLLAALDDNEPLRAAPALSQSASNSASAHGDADDEDDDNVKGDTAAQRRQVRCWGVTSCVCVCARVVCAYST
jgi:hypothetical protein